MVLKAGSNWAGFRGNVDNLSIGVAGTMTTFDFEAQSSNAGSAFRPENVTITAECGKRFRLTSGNSVGATLTFRVEGQLDSSFVSVPPRPHPDSLAAASFNVSTAGIVRIMLDSVLIARVPTSAAACASYELGYVAAPGVTAVTHVAADSMYAPGAIVTYSFSLESGYEHLIVVVDDTIASSSGTITMSADHVLLVGADPIITPGPQVVAIGTQMRAVLASASPGDAYADLLTSMLRRSEASNASTVAAQIDTAMFLYIDPVADSAALRRFNDDAGGSSFEYEEYNGTSDFYRLTPDDVAYYSKAPASAAKTGGPRLRSRLPGASALLMAAGPAPAPAGTPDEDTRIIFVNGVFNDYGDALKSLVLLRNLVIASPRFGRGTELYPNVTVSLFYNRSHLNSLADACEKRARQEFEYRHFLGITREFADCRAELYNRTLVEHDLIEALHQKMRLRNNSAPELATADALRLARYIATTTHRDYASHAIIVGHSQGNLMIAEAMPRLRQIEGHDLNVGNRCTAALTLAAPAVRADMRFDGSDAYLRGYTTSGDVLLQVGLNNDFPRLATAESNEFLNYRASLLPGIGFISEYHRLKLGRRIHEVRNYLDPAINGSLTRGALTSLHDECVAGSIAISPTSIVMPYLGTQHLEAAVLNRNNHILVQREIDGGQIGAKATYDATTSTVTGVAPTFGTTTGRVLTTNTTRVFTPITLNVGNANFAPFYTESHGGYWERDVEHVTGAAPSLEPTTPPDWTAHGDCPITNTITNTGGNGDYWTGHQLCYHTFGIVASASAYPGITRLQLGFDNGGQPWDAAERGYDIDGNCRGNCRPPARTIAIWYNSVSQVVQADTLTWAGASSYNMPLRAGDVPSARTARPSRASTTARIRPESPR